MSNHIESQLKKGKIVRLTIAEKAHIKNVLIFHMHQTREMIPSSFAQTSWLSFETLSRVMTTFLVVILIGAGTLTYASENTLPGDLLYPIKIHVKEALEVRLASTTEKKVTLQKRQIEKRLAEVKTIQLTAVLSPSQTESVREAFVDHAEDFHKNVNKLQAEGKEEIVIAVTTELLPTLTEFKNETTVATVAFENAPSPFALKVNPVENSSEDTAMTEQVLSENDFAAVIQSEVVKVMAEAEESKLELLASTTHEEPIPPQVVVNTTIEESSISSIGGLVSEEDVVKIPTATSSATQAVLNLGSLYGTVSIVSPCTIQLLDTTCINQVISPTDLLFTNRKLYIYTQDEQSLVATVSLDPLGAFTVALPEGTYLLDVTRLSASESAVTLPYTVVITKDHETKVAISITVATTSLLN